MEVHRTMAGRLLRPVNGVTNVTTWRGDVIVGTIPANGAGELNENQIRHQNKTAMEVLRTMAGRLLRPVNGVNNVSTWRGDVIVGTIPANGASELNQNQMRHQR